MNKNFLALSALMFLVPSCGFRKCCKKPYVTGQVEICKEAQNQPCDSCPTVANEVVQVRDVVTVTQAQQPMVADIIEEDVDEDVQDVQEREVVQNADEIPSQVVDEEDDDLDESLAFNKVQFDYNSKSLRKDQYINLASNSDKARKVVEKGYKLRVEGHASTEGHEVYNVALSQKRAQSVVAYLNKQGVESSKVEVLAYGSSKPLINGNKEEQAPNRRVEILAFRN